MSALYISLFGPPRAERDGAPAAFRRRQTLALLAYLAATDQPHGRDVLATLLWPELDEQESHGALRRSLYDLGRTIGKGWLELGDGHVQLPAKTSLRVDIRRFHDLAAQVAAHAHAADTLCDGCLAALTEATGLYRDDFLAGFTLKGSAEFDAWQTFTTESLRLELAAVLEKLAGALARRRQHDLASPHARRWLALDPLNEASHRLLMQLRASAGDRSGAARQYEQCARLLAAELGVEPAAETTALYRELIRGGPPAQGEIAACRPAMTCAVEQPAAAPAPRNLPPDATPFIGRQAALSQVAERLADPACHLLTILGPGGIGKTRLAIQAARNETGRFPNGVYFVDLAPVPSAELLSATILRTLQAPQQSAEPDQQLIGLLKDRQMLLVLDNYEHLLTGPGPDRRDGYGLVMKMVESAPQLKLLVTSRVRLKVPAEWLVQLEGLKMPPSPSPSQGEGASFAREGEGDLPVPTGSHHSPAKGAIAALKRYSATALFLECLRRFRPDLRLAADHADTIAHICRLLEGVPLAIEMAAAWARILPLDEIAHRLEHGLDLLTTTLRGVPERQRSMVAAFDHSWRLLTPAEQRILRRLSVFRGGFTLEAAGAVAGASLADLANLADASWLSLAPAGRYTIHELVRQYCADRLEQEPAGESADQVQRRHAAYFESLLIAQWGRIFRRKGTIAELAPDMGNLMAAWYWALAADDLKLVWGLGNGLACLADRQGQNLEIAHVLRIGIERLRAAQVAERGGQEERWRDRAIALAMVLANQSERFVRLGRLGDSEACLAEAADWLAEAEAGDAAWAEAHWFHRRMVAWTHYYRDDFVGSLQAWHEVLAELQTGQLALWPYTGDVAAIWLPETYWGRGFNALALGDFPEALRLGEQGLALAEQLGLGLAPGFASHLLAWALLSIGDYERADQVARRFLSIANTYGESLMTAMALSVLGRTQFRLGRYDEARTWWRRGLALARKTGLRGNVVACLVGLGDIELVLGNVAAAQRLYEQCLALVGQPAAAGCPRFAPSPGALPVLIGSGRVALRQGWPTAALERFRQVLSAPSRRVTTTAEALAYVSEALTQEGELEWAAGMCGFLLNWSGTPYHIREVAEKLLGEMTNRLPPKELGDAVRRGEPWRLDEVVARVAGNQ